MATWRICIRSYFGEQLFWWAVAGWGVLSGHPWTVVALACLWLWSIRLTHNYFRRERYQLGAREDWRFARRRQESRHFWWFSFFYAFVSQQIMLVGLTLPYWAIHTTALSFGVFDVVIAVAAVTGVVIAYFADTQLARYMARALEPLILDTGLWRYSRHPNSRRARPRDPRGGAPLVRFPGFAPFGAALHAALGPVGDDRQTHAC